jgi:hypothetical protein
MGRSPHPQARAASQVTRAAEEIAYIAETVSVPHDTLPLDCGWSVVISERYDGERWQMSATACDAYGVAVISCPCSYSSPDQKSDCLRRCLKALAQELHTGT